MYDDDDGKNKEIKRELKWDIKKVKIEFKSMNVEEKIKR